MGYRKEIVQRDIWTAKKRIASYVNKTPLIYSSTLSALAKTSVHLKLENLHTTNAFKIRGAANKILSLSEEERKSGITTFSTGNFGMSVAYLADKLGINAEIGRASCRERV